MPFAKQQSVDDGSRMTESDHRTRVAAERREKTRLRLIESALHVFSEKGIDAPAIDDVIAAAGVSRGTFYNYFKTRMELLLAVSEELGNQLLRELDRVTAAEKDPARRLAHGLRLLLHTARAHPPIAQFLWRIGFNAAGPESLIHTHLPRDIRAGFTLGRFKDIAEDIAFDLVAGTTLAAIFALSTRPVPEDYSERIVWHILLALGLDPAVAEKTVRETMPHPFLDDSPLLARFPIQARQSLARRNSGGQAVDLGER